jgi:proteasome accessory factor C
MAERKPKQPPLKAQDKLAFLLSLVPYLMDRDRVPVAEAARHFGVAEEQIREAVRLIGVSGIPGETTMYQHGDLFDIAWDAFEDDDEIVLTNLVAIDDSPRFSQREAAALIAGLQYLSSLPENADRSELAGLMAKLSRGASADPTPVAVAGGEADETLALLRDSVTRGLQVEFDYVNAMGESERRRIDPLRVESADADWYVRGWDHSREAVRTFRLDRISNPAISREPITHGTRDVVLPDTLFEGSPDDLVVTLDVAAGAASLLADYVPEGAVSEERDGRIRTTVRVSHYHGLKRLIASMPGVAVVVEPAEARAAVAEWAAAGAARYR